MNTQLLQQARMLDVNEQIELVEAIWDGIAANGGTPALTEKQAEVLDQRLSEHLARPDDVIAWSEVKAKALIELGQ